MVEHLRRQAGILRNAGARLLITLPEGRRLAGLLRAQTEVLEGFESIASLETPAAPTPLPQVENPEAAALIQYTSGSTGDPKGVVLSHANLLANIRAMGEVMEASSADVFVSWLPLYHDMGLIGAWLGCMYFGSAHSIIAGMRRVSSVAPTKDHVLPEVRRARSALPAGLP